MATETTETQEETGADPKLYELAFLLSPLLAEAAFADTVQAAKQEVEKLGGKIIEEGEAALCSLAYPIKRTDGQNRDEFTQAYFGWFKFDLVPRNIIALKTSYEHSRNMIRFLIMRAMPTPAPRLVTPRCPAPFADQTPLSASTPEVATKSILSASAEAELEREIENMLKT